MLFDKIKAYFASDKQADINSVLQDPIAWGGSSGLWGEDFPTYNPDDLIGRKGVDIYRKMMLDEQVKAVVRFRINSITGRGFFFEPPATDSISEEEAGQRAALFAKMVEQIPGAFKNQLDAIMSAMYQGFSLTEKVHGIVDIDGKAHINITKLNAVNPSSILPYFDDHGELLKIVQQVDGREQALDITNFIHYVNNPAIDNFYGQSEIREAYRAYFSKDVAIRQHNMWLERMAGGFIWAQPRDGKSLVAGTQEYNNLRNALDSLRNNTRMILPDNIDLNIETPTDTNAFENAVAMHDKAIAKALLVPNLLGLSEQGSTGSFAQSKTQLEAFLWDLDAQATQLAEVLNDQVFKQLGELNFADGVAPKFRFKPLSTDQVKDLIASWVSLSGASVIESDLNDENFMRGLLGAPQREAPVPEEGDVEVTKQDTALDGAQVASMLSVTENVALGLLDKQSAIQILITAYPITLIRAQLIINPIEVKENGQNNEGSRAQNKEDGEGTRNEEGAQNTQGQRDQAQRTSSEGDVNFERSAKKTDEYHELGHDGGCCGTATHRGNRHKPGHADANHAVKFARHASARRVNFSAINRAGTLIENEFAGVLASQALEITDTLMESLPEDFGDVDTKLLNSVRLAAPQQRELRKTSAGVLRAGWTLGEDNAKMELQKALGERRTIMSKVNFAHIEGRAAQLFDLQSFTMAGNLGSQIEAIFKSEIMAGIKYNRSQAEVKQAIYARMVSRGYVDVAEIPAGFVTPTMEAIIPAYHMENIVRTNTFEAVNQARKEFFLDAALDGFVEAFEYSAILDDATTAVCAELGDPDNPFIRPVDDPIWDVYSPGNHFQCRALLIALVQGDEWTATEGDPANQPQEGFGK